MSLIDKIVSRKAVVGVIGCGYVGLPLAVEFAKKGFQVIAFDIDGPRVDQINKGDSYIPDVPSSELSEVTKSGHLIATTDFKKLKDVDTVSICVPTPLRKTRDPDISYIVKSLESIVANRKEGQLIVLESTTYPGTTREVMLPELEEKGKYKVGQDFYLAFSPERVDPGNQTHSIFNTPKVVGGITPTCTRAVSELYGTIVTKVVPVSSPESAEMVKLLENTFRSVNIGLVNELALMSHILNVNIWEVIEAAATKPFGFMPFFPGPGLGGHCIPIDPHYLSWKAKQSGFEARFIELAGVVNGSMPHHVLTRINDALNEHSKCLKGSRILIVGVAYKKNVNDLRESPALDLMVLLEQKGVILEYTDPYISSFSLLGREFHSANIAPGVDLSRFDAAVVVTDHTNVDYLGLTQRLPVIVDTRNVFKGITNNKIFGL